jgi:hypothetical protein
MHSDQPHLTMYVMISCKAKVQQVEHIYEGVGIINNEIH